MPYVDGFVLPLHPDKHDAYKALAETFAREARKLGGISVESLGDGLEQGKITSFPRSVQAQEGENVVFSFVIWPDKATRDAGMKSVMDDPRMKDIPAMPFDGKRMIFGGFETVVNVAK